MVLKIRGKMSSISQSGVEVLMIPRKLQQNLKGAKKSVLLLGPRQTGKSTLIKSLKPELSINLIHEPTYLAFASNPSELEQRIQAGSPKTVLIDEIQRLPSLLNTVQFAIDEIPNPPKFFLTGSSARKLKRGNANLLPGRIYSYRLGPLAACELSYEISESSLGFGTLPGVHTEDSEPDKEKLLSTYAGVYLKEEIQAEALTKNIEGFARFLHAVARECTRYLDLTKLASQAQVDRHSASRWIEILEDTLILHRVDAFTKSSRKRLVKHPRFFLFDNGLLNALLGNFVPSSDRMGMLFENLFLSQLMASSFAMDVEIRVSNYRTEHGAEIDFIVEINQEVWAIECKSTHQVAKVNQKPFASFREVCPQFLPVVVHMGKVSKQIDGVDVLPWQECLKNMGL